MRKRKLERESERKGRNLGLIRSSSYHHTAADDFEIYLESEAPWHLHLGGMARRMPAGQWPDEVYESLRWLIVHHEYLSILGLFRSKG